LRRLVSADGQLSVWAREEVRPDPFHLPAEYRVPLTGRGATDHCHERISVSREEVSFSVGPDGVRVPLKDYLGVSMSVALSDDTGEDESKAAMVIVLEHEDPALNVPLFVAWDCDDVVAMWHAWARALGVPLRLRGMDGVSDQINEQIGTLAKFPAIDRRLQANQGKSRSLTRTLRRSSSPVIAPQEAQWVEKIELIARQ